MDIDGRTAVVTGANRGIGQQLVRALLDAGATRVYACARRLESLEETAALDPVRVVCRSLDVTHAADVAQAARVAQSATLVFNNAAQLEFAPAMTVSADAMNRHLAVNLCGLLSVSQHFAARMAGNGGGALVNVLSLLAREPEPRMAAYSASKAAAWSLTQSLRAGLRDHGIAVHAVFPGPVDTQMLAALPIRKASPQAVATEIVAGVLAGCEDIYPDAVSRRWAECFDPRRSAAAFNP